MFYSRCAISTYLSSKQIHKLMPFLKGVGSNYSTPFATILLVPPRHLIIHYSLNSKYRSQSVILDHVVTLGGDTLGPYIDLIGEVLQNGQVRRTRKRRAGMIQYMNVDEARGVCKDRSRWRSVVSAYPHEKKA